MATPRFTIILPVHNGGEYLKQTVASILGQAHDDFELAVLENASDDGTPEWLSTIGDARLKVYPSDSLLPVEANWARALEIPRGEYMTLIGHDDLLDANYLQVMDGLIARHPEAGIYHAHFRYIDGKGKLWRASSALPERETAAEYLTALFSVHRDTWGTGYLYRTARYDAVGGIPRWPKLLFADDALWMSLMHGTYKATAAEPCFACRVHADSTGASASWRYWLQGMHRYIPFLKDMAAANPDFKIALDRHAPDYFLHWAHTLLMRAAVEATKKNTRLEAKDIDAIAEALAAIAPAAVPEFRNARNHRVRIFINRSWVARTLYNLYIYGRYGEWRGQRVR